jgi:hypothetical protein
MFLFVSISGLWDLMSWQEENSLEHKPRGQGFGPSVLTAIPPPPSPQQLHVNKPMDSSQGISLKTWQQNEVVIVSRWSHLLFQVSLVQTEEPTWPCLIHSSPAGLAPLASLSTARLGPSFSIPALGNAGLYNSQHLQIYWKNTQPLPPGQLISRWGGVSIKVMLFGSAKNLPTVSLPQAMPK